MKTKIMGKKGRLSQRGIALIWVYMLAAFLTTMIYSFYSLSIWQTKTDVVDSSAEIQAFYLAESAVDDMYQYLNAQVADGAAIDTTINRSGNLGTGLTYSASYDPTTSLVNAIGTASTGSNSMVKKILTKIVLGVPFDVPPGVQAGATSSSLVNLSGMLIIDGRDHSADGEAIADGVPGVAYFDSGDGTNYPEIDEDAVAIGGPSSEPNEPGKSVMDPTSLLEINTTNYLSSPEAVFGLTAGDLDDYKYSDPPSTTINGIYYYQAPEGSGGSINIALGTSETPGTGALILDNAQNPNLTVGFSGVFHGVVVVKYGNYNLEAGTMLAGALVNVSSTDSTVAIAGPASNPEVAPARIFYCVQCVESASLPQGLNNSTIAGVKHWANYRPTNPLVYTPKAGPTTPGS